MDLMFLLVVLGLAGVGLVVLAIVLGMVLTRRR
jgi:hypothetical protein